MFEKSDLLTTKQMAEFVANGYLILNEIVPKDLCTDCLAEIESGMHSAYLEVCQPFDNVWPDCAIGKAFRVPKVRGMIHSLLGPNPRYDHHWPHKTPGNTFKGSDMHQDAEYDRRDVHFDIQISFFPQEIPPEMGGTLFVPGSHFRRVYESQVIRYQNVVGQWQAVCPAGTMVVWHHNVWHSARSNKTDRDRYMFKLRLNPTVKQTLHWNLDDLSDPEVYKILSRNQPWHGQEGRLEQFNRAKLWRYLTDNPRFDLDLWWTRIENEPQTIYQPLWR